MRLPDGTSATNTFTGAATLREVVTWLQSAGPTAGESHTPGGGAETGTEREGRADPRMVVGRRELEGE